MTHHSDARPPACRPASDARTGAARQGATARAATSGRPVGWFGARCDFGVLPPHPATSLRARPAKRCSAPGTSGAAG